MTKVTTLSELPRLPSAANRWDLIEGLNAEELQGSAVISGQRILRLVAAGADRRHALGVRFGDLVPGGIYRATAWVKAEPGVRVMIEARDSFDPNTGNPSNYGVVRFDLAARSVVNSTGDIIASGVEAASDDWVKGWVDLRSNDGQMFALIGLLEGRDNRHVFTPADQSVIFGGFEIFPPRVVKSVSQVGSPPPRADIVTKVTNISELPPLPESSSAPNRWDLIEGLHAEEVQGSAVVPGQHILRLVAAGADGRHALGVRFGDLVPGGIYRATAWVKAAPGVRVMIEARDSVDPNTGKPSNYGVAQFDLAARSVINSTGDIIASGVEAATDDWVKVWVDLRSSDGQMFALIGLLEGRNNRHVFTPADQSVIFGGFEIFPPRVVKSVSQVGSPPPRTDIVTKVTNISELPPLPESSSAPNRWDLIEGLNAEEVQGSAVVPGQHILRLVAAGADGRHALGVRFGDLAPSGIYRAVAWVKAEPGVRVMIEARDSFDPTTGKPSNYGVAQFDLAARSVVNSTGDIIASGVEAASDDWVKLWVDLRSRDGQRFVTIGLLEGPSNLHVFTATDQAVTFGGFEISPRR
jgi:adhesin HecA-like repeat protein